MHLTFPCAVQWCIASTHPRLLSSQSEFLGKDFISRYRSLSGKQDSWLFLSRYGGEIGSLVSLKYYSKTLSMGLFPSQILGQEKPNSRVQCHSPLSFYKRLGQTQRGSYQLYGTNSIVSFFFFFWEGLYFLSWHWTNTSDWLKNLSHSVSSNTPNFT